MSRHNFINSIHIGRRAKAKENLPNNWESLDINNLTLPKGKTVFMFGGNTTTNTYTANGNAKAIESLLDKDQLEKTNILSFYYDDEPFNNKGILSKDYVENAEHVFEKIFKPMIFDRKGNMKEMKGIEQVFDNMVLSAHCGGSAFVSIIINKFYDTLLENYPPNTAKFLINKIQYFAYAPNRLPDHNVNAFIITPFADTSCSWSSAITLAENDKVEIDYPKGTIKKLIKARTQGNFMNESYNEFQKSRALMFRSGNSTYAIPSQMNPDTCIGDHSIECIYKPHLINSGTDYAITATAMHYAARQYLRAFLTSGAIDAKGIFSKTTEMLEKNKPLPQKNPSK